MAKVFAYGTPYECDSAVSVPRGDGLHDLFLYDARGTEVAAFVGIANFPTGYSIENGEWGVPAPTERERLRADVDYLLVAEMTREGLL